VILAAALQFPSIDPIVPFMSFGPFTIGDLVLGPFQLRWYALAYIAGLALGWRYIVGLIRTDRLWAPGKPPIGVADADDYLFWATLGVILGGRIGYVLFYMLPNEAERMRIAADPLTIIRIWEGGMAFHGGLLGVIVATVWFCARRKASLLGVGDLVAAAAPIGLFFGRIANFINGELWGRETTAPWGMVFCNERVRAFNGGTCPAGDVARHPSQIYEALLEGVLLFSVIWWFTHRLESLKRPGLNCGIFLVAYGLSRALLELVREPDAQMPESLRGYVTMGMLLSLPMILIGAYLIARAMRTEPQPA
jgi:phosphatidylglycerol:prolipoprotein diacylglycerol transferase